MSSEHAAWRKSSHSGGAANECVEVAPLTDLTGVRDTKDRGRGHIEFPRSAWAAMTVDLKRR